MIALALIVTIAGIPLGIVAVTWLDRRNARKCWHQADREARHYVARRYGYSPPSIQTDTPPPSKE